MLQYEESTGLGVDSERAAYTRWILSISVQPTKAVGLPCVRCNAFKLFRYRNYVIDMYCRVIGQAVVGSTGPLGSGEHVNVHGPRLLVDCIVTGLKDMFPPLIIIVPHWTPSGASHHPTIPPACLFSGVATIAETETRKFFCSPSGMVKCPNTS